MITSCFDYFHARANWSTNTAASLPSCSRANVSGGTMRGCSVDRERIPDGGCGEFKSDFKISIANRIPRLLVSFDNNVMQKLVAKENV